MEILMPQQTVTKKDLAKSLSDKHDIVQSDAKELVQTLLDTIADEISTGNRLELRDFGVFEPRVRNARKARNPKTNEPVSVGPKVVIGFKAGKKMSERAQNALQEL